MGRRSYVGWLCAAGVVMFVLPFVVARWASECAGMALCMLLFLVVNPLFSIMLGACCGLSVRRMWSLPLVASLFFLAGAWLFFSMWEPWFAVYAAVYLLLGLAAMGISRCVGRRRTER